MTDHFPDRNACHPCKTMGCHLTRLECLKVHAVNLRLVLNFALSPACRLGWHSRTMPSRERRYSPRVRIKVIMLVLLMNISGHVHILDYIHEHGGLLSEHVVASAFSGGSLECLEYLRKAGLFTEIVNRTLVVENAVASNEMKPKFRTVGGWGEERFLYVSTLSTLQYALALGCIVSPFLLQSAASTGNLEICGLCGREALCGMKNLRA